jgi:hypothetical protein
MKRNKIDHENKVDFIFGQVPLWPTYSGLPQLIGATAWCVFRRLLELRYRFGSTKFFYPFDKLCKTTGIKNKQNLRRNLDILVNNGLMRYKTLAGRGNATEFEIIEPIKAPLCEEDVYRLHPRLRSHSYKNKILEEAAQKISEQYLLNGENKKVSNQYLLEEEKVSNQYLLEEEKVSNQYLLETKKVLNQYPNKKDIYKKDNNNKKDLSHEKEKNLDTGKAEDTPAVTPIQETGAGEVVVAINVNKLKEYGISGDDAEKFLKKYSQSYLAEKIEIIEFKRSNGDEIRNIGGMLRKAIAEDWQPPPGFTTRAQREQEARRKREAEELAIREAKEKEERERIERDRAKIVEEWRKTATQEELEEITERARREILDENPGQNERWLGPPIRLREEKIIVEEYAK